MTTWIGTGQCGWDTQSIGFHSISGCTGLIVCTDQWVAGWHVGGGAGGDYRGSGQTKAGFQGSAFLDYMRAINPNGWPALGLPANVTLYSVHVSQADWQDALRGFAGVLGYNGPAYGLELQPMIGTDSVDVVATRNGHTCQIEYKRTRKMTHVKQSDGQRLLSVVQTVRGGPTDPVRTQPILNNESASAAIVPTFWNNGAMHRAGAGTFMTVNV